VNNHKETQKLSKDMLSLYKIYKEYAAIRKQEALLAKAVISCLDAPIDGCPEDVRYDVARIVVAVTTEDAVKRGFTPEQTWEALIENANQNGGTYAAL